jgi:hypothetical protein
MPQCSDWDEHWPSRARSWRGRIRGDSGQVQCDCERPYAEYAEFEADSGYYESDLDRIPSELYLSMRYGIPLARDVQALETG